MKIDLNEREIEILQTALEGIVDKSAGFTEELLDSQQITGPLQKTAYHAVMEDMILTLGMILKKLK